jgi:protoporphyrinogen oxidase
VEAKKNNALSQGKPRNFDEWILRVMGSGIADIFMRPYNFKVWAVPTTMMQAEWLGERVATVDVDRAISNVILSKEDAGWGPNAVFKCDPATTSCEAFMSVEAEACPQASTAAVLLHTHALTLGPADDRACERPCRFPKKGGTGGIWRSVSKLLPPAQQRFNAVIMSLDVENRAARCSDGTTIEYEALVTTVPLDVTLRWAGKAEWAAGLEHSSSHVVGIGIRGECPHGLKCWLYYPEDNCPFYRHVWQF